MLTWSLVPFAALDGSTLYEAIALRTRVFIVEQNCPYQDCDGLDRIALHLLGRSSDGVIVAYARLLPPGSRFAEASIGRVVTAPEVRRQGCGRPLMHEAIARTRETFGGPIRIGAQKYLEKFYGGLGFEVAGEPYDEDGIMHVEMLLPAT